ncbi:hypothetical protein JCM19232_5087 [Vibrio ishigakensis]|uniref:Uncharacterized protein n=1 Tax=Vibrio ishigakensis TaxID=1481914 RepID=A0A0B8PG66_9VIBR|nr:hypothetical protein JCM19232_5087 [Vibrio ishigakensis]
MTLTGAKTLSDLSHDSLVQNSKKLGEVLNLPERNFIPELESA